jgi:hypothetical protein
MEPVGRLTMSGKLYEGNYPEWAERMYALLDEHYGGVEPDYSSMSSATDPRDLVRAEVSPTILARLSDLLTTNATPDDFGGWPTLELAYELVSYHLKKAAQPFKLMDLPLELRKDIYDLAMRGDGDLRWSLGAPIRRRRIHPITRVSRTLRKETFRRAWSKFRLCLEEFDSTFFLSVSNEYFFHKVHLQLRPLYGTQYLSELRAASLDLRVRRSDRSEGTMPAYSTFKLHFTYSPGAGLQMDIPVNAYHALTPESVNRLKSHVEWASRDHEDDYDQCGGALIRALTAFPELWQEDVLVCEFKLRA